MTDGILLAEIAERPAAQPLRHDHRRRGARAVAQHRLPARLPQAAAAAAAGPQGRHHLGDDRPGAVRRPLRGRADRRGLRPDLPGRGPVPAAGRRRRRPGVRRSAPPSTSWPAEGPGDVLVFLSGEREIRDTADALRRSVGRRHRGAAAVRPAVGRRAAPGLHPVPADRAGRPPDRAGDQRRRDVADGAGHPVRRRPRHRPDLPVQPAHQGAAAADRGDQPGVGDPAGGPLRPGRGRRVHPAVQRGGLRRPPGVHRARDPADQPGERHPADDRARPRGHRRLPVRRAAGDPQHPGRRPAADRARGARRRCAHPGRAGSWPQLPVDPRLGRMVVEADRNGVLHEVLVLAAALSIQDPRERPQDKQQAAAQAHARFADETSDFLAYLEPVDLREGAPAGAGLVGVPPAVQAGVPQPPADPRVAGHPHPAAPGHPPARAGARDPAPGRRDRQRPGAPVAARRAAVAGRHARRREARVRGSPRRPLLGRPGLGAVQEDPALGGRRRARRDEPAVGPGESPACSRSGSRLSPATSWCVPTPSRTGTASRPR